MNLLDESGIKWKRSHELINGNLFCTISVWDSEIKEWVSRQDVGVESNTEKEKGQASDAFKRAGFNFGIGRELYTAPFIWISADKYTAFTNKNGKPATYDKFSVSKIGYDNNKEINELEIVNQKNQVVFKLGQRVETVKLAETAKEPVKAWNPVTRNKQLKEITAIGVQLGYSVETIDKRIHLLNSELDADKLISNFQELYEKQSVDADEVPFK